MGYKFPSIHRLSGLVHPPGAEHSGTSASPEWPFSYSRDRFNLIRPSNAILIQTVTPLSNIEYPIAIMNYSTVNCFCSSVMVCDGVYFCVTSFIGSHIRENIRTLYKFM